MKLGKDYVCNGQMDIFDLLNPKAESQNQTTHKIAKCLNTELKNLTVYPASEHIKELYKGNAYYCSQDDKETYMSVLSRCKADINKIPNSMKYCYYEIDEELYCCNYTKYENVTNTTSEKGIIANKTREKCLFNKENTCTIDGASEIAKSDGYKCNGKCCRGCTEDCGARCSNSVRPKQYNPIEDYASRGSGFENGKKRIREYFDKEKSTDSRAKFLKKEHGFGGFSGPCKEPFKVFDGQTNCFGKDNVIKYYNAEMKVVEVVVTWKELAETIATMINEDRY